MFEDYSEVNTFTEEVTCLKEGKSFVQGSISNKVINVITKAQVRYGESWGETGSDDIYDHRS